MWHRFTSGNGWRIACAIVAALIVLGAGLYYAKHRKHTYQSQASFVLVPSRAVHDPQLAGNVLPTIDTSGALGTFVELLAARGPQLVPGYTYTVRAVPSTRVIDVTAQGARAGVQNALWSLINNRHNSEKLLRDLWSLAVLQTPTPPVAAGPSSTAIIGATLALALLAALAVLLLLGRLLPAPPETVEPELVAPDPQLALDAPDEDAQRRPRGALEPPHEPATP